MVRDRVRTSLDARCSLAMAISLERSVGSDSNLST
jgi:hypothetical protein